MMIESGASGSNVVYHGTTLCDEIGFDQGAASFLLTDLSPDNADRYTNAGIWAELFVDAVSEKAELNQEYVFNIDSLVEGARGVLSFAHDEVGEFPGYVERFFGALGHTALSDEMRKRARLGYRQGSSEFTEAYSVAEIAGDFVSRIIEWLDLGEFEEETVRRCGELMASLAPDELERFAGKIESLPFDRERLKKGLSKKNRPGENRGLQVGDGIKFNTRELGRLDNKSVAELFRQKAQFEREFEGALALAESSPDVDQDCGPKFANLARIDGVVSDMREAGIGTASRIHVPRFTGVPATIYDQYVEGDLTEEDLEPYLRWIKEGSDKRYLVRSSALNSEDGEHMGAGVYDTVLLPQNPTLKELYDAVTEIYDSVNSDFARNYRSEIGVEEEKMGLVMQELVGDLQTTILVTLDTVLNGVPQLASFSIDKGSHPLSEREQSVRSTQLTLDRLGSRAEFGTFLLRSAPDGLRTHIPPDTDYVDPEETWLAVQAAVLAERVLGRPVQVEALIEGGDIYLVQARPLPDNWLQPIPFEGFPDDLEPWYEGSSSGVWDGVEATVVGMINSGMFESQPFDKNPYRLCLFDGSFCQGDNLTHYMETLMQLSGEERSRVIVLIQEPPDKNGSGYGHLETFFADLGIKLLFYEPSGRAGALTHGQTVEVYSNGYRGKIYMVDEKDRAMQTLVRLEEVMERVLSGELPQSALDEFTN
jgi:hypothetical protein